MRVSLTSVGECVDRSGWIWLFKTPPGKRTNNDDMVFFVVPPTKLSTRVLKPQRSFFSCPKPTFPTRIFLLLYCTVLCSTVQYCTVLYSTVQYCTVLHSTVQYSNKNIRVGKVGFGHEKKLRWGLSTRVLNFVGGTTKKTISSLLVRFPGGVLKSQIQPERSTHSPTEVKETLN